MTAETELLSVAASAMAGRDTWQIELLMAAGRPPAGDEAEALRELLASCAEAMREAAAAENETFKLEMQWDNAKDAVAAWIAAGTPCSGPKYEKVARLFDLDEGSR